MQYLITIQEFGKFKSSFPFIIQWKPWHEVKKALKFHLKSTISKVKRENSPFNKNLNCNIRKTSAPWFMPSKLLRDSIRLFLFSQQLWLIEKCKYLNLHSAGSSFKSICGAVKTSLVTSSLLFPHLWLSVYLSLHNPMLDCETTVKWFIAANISSMWRLEIHFLSHPFILFFPSPPPKTPLPNY